MMKVKQLARGYVVALQYILRISLTDSSREKFLTHFIYLPDLPFSLSYSFPDNLIKVVLYPDNCIQILYPDNLD